MLLYSGQLCSVIKIHDGGLKLCRSVNRQQKTAVMGGESDSESELQPPKKKKYTGAYKFKTQPKPEWFTEKYKDAIKPSQMDCYSVYS